jgi:hypothetical protein
MGYSKTTWATGDTITAAKLNNAETELELLDGLTGPLQNGSRFFTTTSTGNDTYVLTFDPAHESYVTGMIINFKADVANTGACTLNVNGLGAKAIKKNVSSDLTDGDIQASQIVTVIYDGTNFQLVSAFDFSRGILTTAGDLLYASAANTLARLAIGSAYSKLFVNSAGNEVEYKLGNDNVVVSDTIILADDTEENTGSTSYVLMKSFTIGSLGYYRVKYEYKSAQAAGYNASADIRVNGVSVNEMTTSGNVYVAVSYNTAFLYPGATIDIYIKTENSAEQAFIQNARVCGTYQITETKVV